MTTVLAIDQGTSGTKAIVVNDDGTVRGMAEHLVRPTYLPGGGVELDPHDLLASVVSAGRAAVSKAGLPVDIVTIANQGETVLAWDPDTGQPLSNMIVWQDRRAEPICDDLAEHKKVIEQRTGLVLDPYFSAPKQAWLRRHVTRDGVVTTSDSWLIYQLCGAFVTDTSTASRSLVTDLNTATWDRELLALFDLQDERLPEIVPCDVTVGATTLFGGSAAVGGLVVDQQAALLGEGCTDPGDTKCTFGTGAFLLTNTGATAVRSSAGLTSSVAWQVRGQTTYCFDGQVYTAASAVRWMEQLGLISTPADMDRVAAEDNGGVIAVPALAGLGAPWWRPDARASVRGMTLSTTPGHLVLAVLQGIAAQVAEIGSLVAHDLGDPLARLRADGGLTQCRTLMQATADLTQLEVEVYPSAHATPLGAAALARMALDPSLALADAVPSWTPTLTYQPQWSPDQTADFRGRWAEAAASA